MKIFSCDNCGQLIYFENVICNNCGYSLGYCYDTGKLCSFKVGDDGIWTSIGPTTTGRRYKPCKNYSKHAACNWMIPVEYSVERCVSCNLNWVIPDISVGDNHKYWQLIEKAKRRLVFSVLHMRLPLHNKKEDKLNGLAFKFMEGPGLNGQEHKPVMTGHNRGIITLNLAEANDAIRVKMRDAMKERYRTLLGHFRHEVGHYYWMLLVDNRQWLEPCRQLFGDDRQDYAESLKKYYAKKSEDDNIVDINFISAYASSHPWEDWAETWAHYMHIYDTLETANSWGLRFSVKSVRYSAAQKPNTNVDDPFDRMIDNWDWASCALNSVNRSMGFNDPYPFVISEQVKEKLRFVHNVIHENSVWGFNS